VITVAYLLATVYGRQYAVEPSYTVCIVEVCTGSGLAMSVPVDCAAAAAAAQLGNMQICTSPLTL